MPDLGSVIRNAIGEAEALPNGVTRAVSVTDAIAKRILEEAFGEGLTGLDAAGAAAAEEASTALAALLAVPSVLGMVGLVLGLVEVTSTLQRALRRLPGPFHLMGNIVAAALTSPIQILQKDIETYLVSHAGTYLRNHVTVATFVGSYGIPHNAATPGPRPTPSHPAPTNPQPVTQGEIANLQRQINTLAQALGVTQHTGSVPRQVWDEIHTLQGNVATLQRVSEAQLTDIQSLQSGLASLGHQVESLIAEVHGIRTVSAGWQDIERELERQITTLTQLDNQLQSQIHHQARQLTQLAPLGLLLQPGIRGLRTLRQLEDTPCMCPKFGNIPNELGTALALMEFIENG